MNVIKKLAIVSFMIFFVFFYIFNDQNNTLTLISSFAQNASTNLKKETIPSYAVDQFGHKTAKFPLYSLTNDKKTEIGLTWNPSSIKTNEPITFLIDFFSYPQNEPLHLWPYNFILIQNGKEIYRTSGMTQLGSSTQSYVFNSPGTTFIKIQSVQDTNSFSQYGTIVYNNPNSSSTDRLNNFQYNTNSSILELITSYMLNYGALAFVIVVIIILAILIVYLKRTRIKEDFNY
jgi:hypothetical protein